MTQPTRKGRKSKFRAGDQLWAAALRFYLRDGSVEVLMAAKVRARLRAVIEAGGSACDPAMFKRVVLHQCPLAARKP